MGQVPLAFKTTCSPTVTSTSCVFIGSKISIRLWCYHRKHYVELDSQANISTSIVSTRSIKKQALISWSLPPFHASVAPICNTEYYHQIPIISTNAHMYPIQKWSQKSGIWLWNFLQLCYFIKVEFPLIIHYIIYIYICVCVCVCASARGDWAPKLAFLGPKPNSTSYDRPHSWTLSFSPDTFEPILGPKTEIRLH